MTQSASWAEWIDRRHSIVTDTVGVGGGPVGVAYDGSSVWVANYYTNDVTKLVLS